MTCTRTKHREASRSARALTQTRTDAEALTEVQELLHGQGRRRELGEVVDVFGHVGQRRRLHEGADELHLTAHLRHMKGRRASARGLQRCARWGGGT